MCFADFIDFFRFKESWSFLKTLTVTTLSLLSNQEERQRLYKPVAVPQNISIIMTENHLVGQLIWGSHDHRRNLAYHKLMMKIIILIIIVIWTLQGYWQFNLSTFKARPQIMYTDFESIQSSISSVSLEGIQGK